MGSPLRPTAEDSQLFSQLVGLQGGAARQVLILGVTPELYALPWPEGSTVRAVDRSPDMIRAIWPGPAENAVRGEWLNLPFGGDSFDTVLCDGGLHLLEYPTGHHQFAESVARVLTPGGLFALRLFARPETAESEVSVWESLKANQLSNFHEFKLRVLMALQENPVDGIQVSRVEQAIRLHIGGDFARLAKETRWPLEEILTLESYRDSPNVYHLLTVKESLAALTQGGHLRFETQLQGTYPLAEQCPVVLLRKM